MRRVRTAVLGVAVAVCALGVLSTSAFAKEKTPVIFGKFVANAFGKTITEATPVEAKTKEGSLEDLVLGPVETEECAKELSSKGEVTSESSETFFQSVKFKDCMVTATFGKGPNKVKVNDHVSFTLGMEFHSNRSVEIGAGEESDVKLSEASIAFKISKTSCTIVVPAQTVPIKAEIKPEKEFESAEYTTIEEKVEGKKALKMFPSGFQKGLTVSFELKKVESLLKPNAGCESEQPVNKEPESPRFGYVEYHNGKIEAELEDITIKDGNLSFEPA